ncbi:hypothetical protein [Halovenus marina]|uniref:hypothetical protein n=1 Tax=Halovenus marina TaxID=3396621 RepID=UPI003F5642DB
MPYCPDCGAEFSKGDTFCVNCGKELPEVKKKTKEQSRQARVAEKAEQNRQPPQKQPKQAHTQEKPSRAGSAKQNETVPGQENLRLGIRAVGAISALGLIAGVFLPWVTAQFGFMQVEVTETVLGIQHNWGWVTVVVGVLSGAFFFDDKPELHVLGSVLALITGIVLLLYLNDPLIFKGDISSAAELLLYQVMEVGVGVYVCLVGAAGVVVAGFYSYLAQ